MSFDDELKNLLEREGFYSNRISDRGGETIFGISRRRWPGWEGWKIVDDHRIMKMLDSLKTSSSFIADVRSFYLNNFWIPCGAEVAPAQVGTLLWDAAVQHGVESSVIFLQQSLNVLNDLGKRWKDLVEDGDFGPETQKALQKGWKSYKLDLIWTMFVVRCAFYLSLTRRDVTQEANWRGWMIRARKLFSETTAGFV
jgi:lysozyme family protein